jgi:hypothetical protein
MKNPVLRVLGLIFFSAIGLGCEGIAVAAFMKMADSGVIRAGMSHDFRNLAALSAAIGLLFLGLAAWLFWPRKSKQPDPISQF